MISEILSIAIWEPIEGKEAECLGLVMELHHLMSRKGYSRDLLYRDAANPQRYVNLRYWKSSAARAEAHEDPDVHKFWAGLGNVMRMQSVIETLERVEEDAKEMQ